MGDDSNAFVEEVIDSFRKTPNSEFEELSPGTYLLNGPLPNVVIRLLSLYVDPVYIRIGKIRLRINVFSKVATYLFTYT